VLSRTVLGAVVEMKKHPLFPTRRFWWIDGVAKKSQSFHFHANLT
jgi:hypothetical protein